MITKAAHPDANIIWGVAFDDNMQDTMRITVIATGFDKAEQEKVQQQAASYAAASGAGASVKSEAQANTDDPDFFDIMSLFNKRQN